MIVLGLTGSIGMGKSAAAQMFRDAGIPVYDADAEVARMYAVGGAAIGPIGQAFPGAVRDGAIDREELRDAVIGKPDALARLETIVHPLTAERQMRFREQAEADGHSLVVLDIPLLFETGSERACDHVCVMTAPEHVQRERVLSRPGMTEQRLASILERQMPDADKRARADFIVSSAFGFDFTRAHIQAIIELLTNQPT